MDWLQSILEMISEQASGLYLTIAGAIACFGLLVAWSLQLGPLRGLLAGLCRVGWVLPLFLAFTPETSTEPLPRTMTLDPVHVLVDDSISMQTTQLADGSSPQSVAQQMVLQLEQDCARLGCVPKITRLSELVPEAQTGFSPLAAGMESWLYKVGVDPWLVLTDGGDWRPTVAWPAKLKGLGAASASGMHKGMIIGFQPESKPNIWIESVDAPPFSFQEKPFAMNVTLRRLEHTMPAERVQLQIAVGGAPLSTANIEFEAGAGRASLNAIVPPLPRGQHLVSVKALPTAEEVVLWDNETFVQVEVMANTVGVLHLLGSPSWDGRFLRRYLKSEPKYDLISFFILRDPWDSQQVNERELSLIPFPVERLFNEELPNFRVVAIQNFTLIQFLQAEFQSNLVKFVLDGGGLLFLGGPRSLQAADLASSPLREILPFETDGRSVMPGLMQPFGDLGENDRDDPKGPGYAGDQQFKVELASPDPHKRALANVYDDWEKISEALTSWTTAEGLHHMERVTFKKDQTTTLLQAVKPDGSKVPLAVASYPGKGRAIWLFTDSMWRLALATEDGAPREAYNRFMHAAMTWLMRGDLKKPLVIKNFTMEGGTLQASAWQAELHGPAARYFRAGEDWQIRVCGAIMAVNALHLFRTSPDSWIVRGPMTSKLASGERCTIELTGRHEAFGSVDASMSAVFPKVLKDEDVGITPQKVESLANLTGAKLRFATSSDDEEVEAWLGQLTGSEGVALPGRYRTLRNFFWVMDRSWFWLLMALLPLEVIIRRWEHLTGYSSRSAVSRGTVNVRES